MASKSSKFWGGLAQFALPIIGSAIGASFGHPELGAGIGGAIGGGVSGKGGLKRAAIEAPLAAFGAKSTGNFGVSNPNTSGFSGILPNFGKSIGSGFGLGNILNAFGGMGGSNPASGTTSAMLSAPGFGPAFSGSPAVKVGLGQGSFAQAPSGGGGGDSGSSAFNPFGGSPLSQFGLGLGIAGLGQGFFKTPKVPDLPQSVVNYQNRAIQRSPLTQSAEQQLQSQLDTPMTAFSADEEAAATHQLDVEQQLAQKQVHDTFASVQPGVDQSTNIPYQQALGRVNDQYARAKAQTVAQLHRQILNDFNQTKLNQIMMARGMNTDQLNQMLQASNFDLEKVQQQLQLNDRDKEYLRNYITNAGGQLAFNAIDPVTALSRQFMLKQMGMLNPMGNVGP